MIEAHFLFLCFLFLVVPYFHIELRGSGGFSGQKSCLHLFLICFIYSLRVGNKFLVVLNSSFFFLHTVVWFGHRRLKEQRYIVLLLLWQAIVNMVGKRERRRLNCTLTPIVVWIMHRLLFLLLFILLFLQFCSAEINLIIMDWIEKA